MNQATADDQNARVVHRMRLLIWVGLSIAISIPIIGWLIGAIVFFYFLILFFLGSKNLIRDFAWAAVVGIVWFIASLAPLTLGAHAQHGSGAPIIGIGIQFVASLWAIRSLFMVLARNARQATNQNN